ncbi:MAG: SAM-dependent methyltransferase [Candidatus Binatia bacterium]|jgi:SAM-dependent methyltransferase
MAHISSNFRQFAYFDQQLNFPEWRGKRILDFGGNAGNFLKEAGSRIDPSDYCCLDLIESAIRTGQTRFPDAKWIFYNRHNSQYNPVGVIDLPIPDLGQRFDYILAYSVFTHTHQYEMVDLVGQLSGILKPGGKLLFTFIDQHHVASDGASPIPNILWRLRSRMRVSPHLDIESLAQISLRHEHCMLLNDEIYDSESTVPDCGKIELQEAFCTTARMKRLFPSAMILAPTSNERQHCCLLTA